MDWRRSNQCRLERAGRQAGHQRHANQRGARGWTSWPGGYTPEQIQQQYRSRLRQRTSRHASPTPGKSSVRNECSALKS